LNGEPPTKKLTVTVLACADLWTALYALMTTFVEVFDRIAAPTSRAFFPTPKMEQLTTWVQMLFVGKLTNSNNRFLVQSMPIRDGFNPLRRRSSRRHRSEVALEAGSFYVVSGGELHPFLILFLKELRISFGNALQ